ncbi:MAG: hypothetical protein PUE12_02360 [Oscillospiraceae bacterium]|nr:hypothetical protein [Oscillospiraceae bacterium]
MKNAPDGSFEVNEFFGVNFVVIHCYLCGESEIIGTTKKTLEK